MGPLRGAYNPYLPKFLLSLSLEQLRFITGSALPFLQNPGNFHQYTICTFLFADFQNSRSNHLGPILGSFSRITPSNEFQFVQNFTVHNYGKFDQYSIYGWQFIYSQSFSYQFSICEMALFRRVFVP